ncbi:sensor histidine kinase [Rubrivivax rivuli]|uniref:histidine kinase n=1 Tax=Rubrivivax rivuli TaxID=1862385 RepID=A0A437RIS1_9BURK|nr:sensor histidine kinase [Rubrivivax rivuli]
MHPLDAELPVALTGSAHGWFTRYRRYPVFSAPWVRGRIGVFALVLLVALLLTASPLVARQPLAEAPLGALAQLAVQLFAPLLIGPLLGLWVRRQGWPETLERNALAAAVATAVLALLAFHQFGSEPLKQAIAEATGAVDESGKRKRVAVSIGISMSAPPVLPASAPGTAGRAEEDIPLSAMTRFSNGVTSALFSFWMAGGVALWGWRRERQGLAALAREQELERAQAQRREAELRLSVLAAQVEPHFLFNTLAGVRSAIATDPARASEMIDHLVDYLRAAIPRLRSSGDTDATLGAQLEIVRAYLGLMSARMPRLSWAVQADDDLLALRCPPLMLISLAENAVKHGAEPKVGPVRVQVIAQRRSDGGLEVTVADDGAGFGASVGGSGLGLSNIRERLRQIHGDAAALVLKALPDGGVAATLSLPPE